MSLHTSSSETGLFHQAFHHKHAYDPVSVTQCLFNSQFSLTHPHSQPVHSETRCDLYLGYTCVLLQRS